MSRIVRAEIIHRVVSYANYTAPIDADKFEEYHGFPIEEAEPFDIETWCEDENINLRLVTDEVEAIIPAAVFVDNKHVWDKSWN